MKTIIEELDENKRLDVYLSEVTEKYSRSQIQNEIKFGNVKVNGKPQKSSYKLKENDEVDFDATTIFKLEPENIPLEIVWEDDNMIVVNKPSNMLTHPTSKEKTGTLVNALLYKYQNNLSDLNGELRRGILHRLDRNTSGLIMVAKNNKTHEFLAKQISERTIEKKYLAIVDGIIDLDEGILDFPIARSIKHPCKMEISAEGKESLTEFKVIERFSDATLVELNLKTGRTHQIRVHLNHIKHPIFNDSLYGARKRNIHTEEQVLQSYKLRFTKPESDEIISLEINKDEKLEKVLKYLKGRQ